MTPLFVDTSGWGNLVDATEPWHERVVSFYREAKEQKRRLITTNYVLAEVVTVSTSPLRIPRKDVIAFITSLKNSPFVEIVHIDPRLDEKAWQLLAKRPDKDWSLVDCASFVVMQERSMTEAMTTDHHFEQAGFICLLKP